MGDSTERDGLSIREHIPTPPRGGEEGERRKEEKGRGLIKRCGRPIGTDHQGIHPVPLHMPHFPLTICYSTERRR